MYRLFGLLALSLFVCPSVAQHATQPYDWSIKYPFFSTASSAETSNNSVFVINDSVVEWALEHTYNCKKKYLGSVLIAALFMSEGAHPLLDFKNVLPERLGVQNGGLYFINGKLYNAHEMGNWLWAVCLSYYRCGVNAAFAARLQTRITEGRVDEANEQKALKYGWYVGKKWRKRSANLP